MRWERRIEWVGGLPFAHLEPVPEPGAPPDFDGGCRQSSPTPPRVEWARDEGGWETVTLEDGASLFFGKLGE